MDERTRKKHRQDSKETLWSVIASNLFSLLKIFLVCILLVYLCVNFVTLPFHVKGPSMYPTVKDGEMGLSNAFTGKFSEVKRGDIVVVYENKKTHTHWVKRVIGMPGESVYCKNDTVYINDVPLNEAYLQNDFAQNIRDTNIIFTEDFEEYQLGKDEYFLMGDNRLNSMDSRVLGAFDRDQIKGVGLAIAIPISKVRIAK
ncbi:MAG: signal peptidase I [Longicatena sp.]